MFNQKLDDDAHTEFGACLITSMQHDHSPMKLTDDYDRPIKRSLMRAVVMRAIAIMPTRELQTYMMSAYPLADQRGSKGE